MRIVPIITAVLVAAALYGVVLERDRLLEVARDLSPSQDTSAENVAEASEEAVEPVEAAAETEAERSGTVSVRVKKSIAQEIDSAVFLRGETEAARQVTVQAETSGVVISEPLRRGAFVNEGDLLCRIDPGTRDASLAEAEARLAEAIARRPEVEARIPEAEARVAEALARLEEAQINANAATTLQRDGFAAETRVKASLASVRSAEAAVQSAEAGLKAAQSGLETIGANIESAEAAVARARTEIERLEVRAPFAGLLETDTAELGSLLQGGGPDGAVCATIIQLDPIKVVGFVPETEVQRVETGAMAGARLTGGKEVSGRVSFISRSADPVTRTFRVEINIPNADLAIRDGQTAELAIQAEGAMAHLLPSSVLTLNDDGALGVRTVTEQSEAQFQEVALLRDTRDGVWLTGLPAEVDVITVGQEYVTDGVPVAPSFEEATQ